MGSTRRKYTREFKAEAVELVVNSGKPKNSTFSVAPAVQGNVIEAATVASAVGASAAICDGSNTALLSPKPSA